MAGRDEFRIGEYWLSKHATSEKWQRTWYDKARRQTRRASLGQGTDDFELARLRLTEWFYQSRRPVDAKPEDTPLQQILEHYYSSYAAALPSAERQLIALRHLNGFFAGKLVSELTHREQEKYVEHRRGRGSADATITREMSVLRAALERARRRGELQAVPSVMDAGAGEARERRLTLPEIAALFNAARSDHFTTFLMLAFNTLARPMALLDLQPFQIDLHARLIALNPPGRKQTKKRRPTVPITNTLLPWVTGITSNYVVSYWGRRVRSVKTAFRDARALAGLGKDVIPYTIRHTMATELRRRGVPAWEVSGMLGHKVGGTTEIYAKFDPSYLGHAVRAIDAFFEELQPLVSRPLIRDGARLVAVHK